MKNKRLKGLWLKSATTEENLLFAGDQYVFSDPTLG